MGTDQCDMLCGAKLHNGPQLVVQWELLPVVEVNETHRAAQGAKDKQLCCSSNGDNVTIGGDGAIV